MNQSHVLSRRPLIIYILALLAFASQAIAEESAAPTISEQVLGLDAMCAENSAAMAARQSEESLYDRLGGEKKIQEIVAEIVRLHAENEALESVMEGIDQDRLVAGVTQFIVAGTGGPAEYTGRDMVAAHAHLKLTNADFLSAGGDVVQAMKNKGCGEEEIQEIVCTLVSLREYVVIDSDKLVTEDGATE